MKWMVKKLRTLPSQTAYNVKHQFFDRLEKIFQLTVDVQSVPHFLMLEREVKSNADNADVPEVTNTLVETRIAYEQVDAECNSEFVTGRLVGINFQEKCFQIQLMSGRSLDVDYSDLRNVETVLIKNRNNVLHVHGQVTYNELDELIAISNVDQLLTVDTRPITINEFVIESECYKINPPLKFVVDFDYDEYFYTLIGDFDIFLIGDSRIEIEDDLDYSLKLFWADYVQDKSEKLAADAQAVGREMLQRFESV